jgi:hypothetical protein
MHLSADNRDTSQKETYGDCIVQDRKMFRETLVPKIKIGTRRELFQRGLTPA